MKLTTVLLLVLSILAASLSFAEQPKDGGQQYLVIASGRPGFASPEEAVVVLEKGILPTFDALMKLKAEGKILAGGLPVADRAFVFILKASSNEEADELLRNLSAWGVLQWEVTPLQSFERRAKKERSVVEEFKKGLQ